MVIVIVPSSIVLQQYYSEDKIKLATEKYFMQIKHSHFNDFFFPINVATFLKEGVFGCFHALFVLTLELLL